MRAPPPAPPRGGGAPPRRPPEPDPARPQAIRLNFSHGAALPDPAGLFNAGFGGNTRRAIDLREGATIEGEAFKDLVRAAAALTVSRASRSG